MLLVSQVDGWVLITLMAVGFVAAFIDSIAGGGGLITVPAYLTAGLPPHMVLGTNKLSATLGVAAAAWAYIKKGFFKPYFWLTSIIATLIGAILGSIIVHFFSGQFLAKFLPIAILAVAVYALWPKAKNLVLQDHTYQPPAFSSAVIGNLLGIYDGFFGPATGSLWTAVVMYVYRMDIRSASAVARFMNFISNISALAIFCFYGNVNYVIGLCVGLATIAGSYVGAHSAIKYGGQLIKPIFITVVIIIALRLIYLEWL